MKMDTILDSELVTEVFPFKIMIDSRKLGPEGLKRLHLICKPFFHSAASVTYVVGNTFAVPLLHCCHRSGNGQGKQKFFKAGKCQGILFWVKENCHFEEKSGIIEIVRLT